MITAPPHRAVRHRGEGSVPSHWDWDASESNRRHRPASYSTHSPTDHHKILKVSFAFVLQLDVENSGNLFLHTTRCQGVRRGGEGGGGGREGKADEEDKAKTHV